MNITHTGFSKGADMWWLWILIPFAIFTAVLGLIVAAVHLVWGAITQGAFEPPDLGDIEDD